MLKKIDEKHASNEWTSRISEKYISVVNLDAKYIS